MDNSQLHNSHKSHQYPDCTDHLHKLERAVGRGRERDGGREGGRERGKEGGRERERERERDGKSVEKGKGRKEWTTSSYNTKFCDLESHSF